MKSTLRRTWAEIDLDAIRHNYEVLRRRIGEDVIFLGVVKADAYGHGAVHVARTLQELGADYLGVSSLDEAMELRANGIVMPILILGHTPADQVPNLITNNITQAVTCLAKAHEYNEAAARFGARVRVHIKVDTGMSRLGVLCAGRHFDTGVSGIVDSCNMPNLEVEGIFTHFSVADEPDADEDYILAPVGRHVHFVDATIDISDPLDLEDHFEETLLEDGCEDMYALMKHIVRSGFDGFLNIDHAFFNEDGKGMNEVSTAYYTGYMKALLHAAEKECAAEK